MGSTFTFPGYLFSSLLSDDARDDVGSLFYEYKYAVVLIITGNIIK